MGRGGSKEDKSEEGGDPSVEDGHTDAANGLLKVQIWNLFSLWTKTWALSTRLPEATM